SHSARSFGLRFRRAASRSHTSRISTLASRLRDLVVGRTEGARYNLEPGSMSERVDTMVKVTLPEMGESVTEGSIVEWRKRVGDFVAEGDALVDVTTDKVDVEIPATASGVVTQILAGEGDTVS